MKEPNGPAKLIAYFFEGGKEVGYTTFHKSAASAHERFADILRRADDNYSRYEIEYLYAQQKTANAE